LPDLFVVGVMMRVVVFVGDFAKEQKTNASFVFYENEIVLQELSIVA